MAADSVNTVTSCLVQLHQYPSNRLIICWFGVRIPAGALKLLGVPVFGERSFAAIEFDELNSVANLCCPAYARYNSSAKSPVTAQILILRADGITRKPG